MQKPEIDDILLLTIESIGNNGEGVCTHNGYTIFVEGVLPGEIIKGRLVLRKNTYGKAELVEIVQSSPDRVKPLCKLFDKCGGCQLMHTSYSKQLEIKKQRVIDAFRSYQIDPVNVLPCLPSPKSIAYRNKIQFPVRKCGDGIALGLYAKGSNELVAIDHCPVHCDLGEDAYGSVQSIIKQSGITAYDPSDGSGELRHVLIKSAVNTQEVLVTLITTCSASETVHHIAKEIKSCCPQVQGILHSKHIGNDNVILSSDYIVLEGQDHIHERLCGITFKVSPASFFQVNPFQAECLYGKALELADLKGTEIVLDAYCGVGTLSLLFAKRVKRVIGVESVAKAIDDAGQNALLNSISNVSFVCAEAEKFIDTLNEIDVVVLNPPRKGCEISFIKGVGRLSPKKIIYISCDPTSLARDLALLCTLGYKVDEVQPYDMFPQTVHVECVVRLSLK